MCHRCRPRTPTWAMWLPLAACAAACWLVGLVTWATWPLLPWVLLIVGLAWAALHFGAWAARGMLRG